MNTFFTSDTHFSHRNIIKYCDRPFRNEREMNETLIAKWNAKVRENDTVYHLGDFALSRNTDEVAAIRYRLNGNIHLIEGNHEKSALSIRSAFTSIQHYREIVVGGQSIVLFHYPMRSWHHNMRGVWHLFGHCHGSVKPYGKSFDIGVDCWEFGPLEFEEVKREMEKRPLEHEETGFVCRDCKRFPCGCGGVDV